MYKQFACYNLGATDTTLDPNVPVQAIHGKFYQWGSNIGHTVTTPGIPISGWNTVNANADNWWDLSKRALDPCPTGFRVPTAAQLTELRNYNLLIGIGSFASDDNYTSAMQIRTGTVTTLTLPATGLLMSSNGRLATRGNQGYYWSSTVYGPTNAYGASISSSNIGVYNSIDSTSGLSVRCVAE